MSTPALVPRLPKLSLPPELRAGDSFTVDLETTLPAGWMIFFVLNAFIANVPARILIGRALDGSYLIPLDGNGAAVYPIAATVTAAWLPGSYDWTLFAVDAQGNNRATLAQGVVNILPDVAGPTPIDGRTDNEKNLANIRMVLAGSLLDDSAIIKIGTRELTKIPKKELLELEAIFESRVRREQGRNRRRRGPAVSFRGHS